MKAIVFSDRSMKPGESPLAHRSAALQPIADKAVIEYTLEELADARIEDVIVVGAPDIQALRELLGNGERWGLRISIVTSRGNEHPGTVLPRLGLAPDTQLLALRGDELRSRGVEAFLKLSDVTGSAVCHATDEQNRVLMSCSQQRYVNLSGLVRDGLSAGSLAKGERVSLKALKCSTVDSLQSLSEASLGLLVGGFAGQIVPGLEFGKHLRRGRLAMADSLQVSAPVYVGDESRLHSTARITGTTVIGANCYVDRDTELDDCVVMPGTYVGANLSLKNAVVTPAGIYQRQRQYHLRVDEPLWVDSTTRPSNECQAGLFERSVGLVAALVSLPVLLLGIAALSITRQTVPVRRESNVSNRRDSNGEGIAFAALRIISGPAWMQRLSDFWQVAAGHRRLFGLTTRDAEATEGWELSLRQVPMGVISGAALMLPAWSPREEKVLAETLLAALPFPRQLAVIISTRRHRSASRDASSIPGQAG